MTSRLALRSRGRSLRRRLEALEDWRAQLPPLAASKGVDPNLLPPELLRKLEPVYDWLERSGAEALTDEHQLVLKEIGEFYESLQSQGVDIYASACKAAA